MAEQAGTRAERGCDEEWAEQERRAWVLRVTHCWKTQAIADELGVSRSTVCRLLRQANERLAKEFREQVEARRAEQAELHVAVAEQALAAIRALWGLDAPKRQDEHPQAEAVRRRGRARWGDGA